jgi:hypothetical protein
LHADHTLNLENNPLENFVALTTITNSFSGCKGENLTFTMNDVDADGNL